MPPASVRATVIAMVLPSSFVNVDLNIAALPAECVDLVIGWHFKAAEMDVPALRQLVAKAEADGLPDWFWRMLEEGVELPTALRVLGPPRKTSRKRLREAFFDSEIETDGETETDGGTDPPFTAADRDRVFEANPGEFFHVLDVGPAQIVVSWIYRLDQISVEAGAAAFWDEHPDVQRVPKAECYFSSDDTQNVANGRAGYTDVTDKVVYIKHGGFRTYARGALHIVGHYEPHEERVFPLTNAARAGCLDKLYRDLLRLGGPALADDITAAGAVVFGARAPSQETCGLCGKPRRCIATCTIEPAAAGAARTLVLGRVCERKLKAAVRIARFVRNGVGSVDAVRAEGMAANAAV